MTEADQAAPAVLDEALVEDGGDLIDISALLGDAQVIVATGRNSGDERRKDDLINEQSGRTGVSERRQGLIARHSQPDDKTDNPLNDEDNNGRHQQAASDTPAPVLSRARGCQRRQGPQ